MNNRPIGVMDSGAGGLTVATVLRKLYPKESIVYFGDSARNPYGERSKEEIIRFAGEIKDFLIGQNVKGIIIACNTITFNVPQEFYEAAVPVTGMSLDYSEFPKVKKAAIFATPASIKTHAHKKGLSKFLPDADIVEVPCDGLAHAIETCAPKAEIKALIRKLADTYGALDAEAATFGCTHYPLVRDLFEEVMPKAVFFDPAEPTVKAAMAKLSAEDLADARGEDHFYFSADPEMAEKLVAQAMGEAHTVETVKLG